MRLCFRRWAKPKLVVILVCVTAASASAFCGFFAAVSDAGMENSGTQTVLVRQGDTTAITLSFNYQGEPNDFSVIFRLIGHISPDVLPRFVGFPVALPVKQLDTDHPLITLISRKSRLSQLSYLAECAFPRGHLRACNAVRIQAGCNFPANHSYGLNHKLNP